MKFYFHVIQEASNKLLKSRVISQKAKKTKYQKNTSNSTESDRTKINFHWNSISEEHLNIRSDKK